MIYNGLSIQENVPLAQFTTFKIGGKARYFITANNPNDLIKAIGWAQENHLAYLVFAGGSNLLLPDDDLPGLVIRLVGGKISQTGHQITAEAGTSLNDLIKHSISQGLAGLEKMAGIYGSVGGAIVGNAGAYGQEISNTLIKVEIWDGEKKRWLKKDDCRFTYRHSLFKEKKYLILKAVFELKHQNKNLLQSSYDEAISKRKEKYPPNQCCAGSFFKNILVKDIKPETLAKLDQSKIIDNKFPVGWLLEQVGAKGMSEGNVQVSDFHANFIVNTGNGKADEVKRLAAKLKQLVKDKFDIELEEEVRII